MKIVLILSLCYTLPTTYGQQNFLTKLPATDERYFFGLQEKYLTELKCLMRIDAIFESKWTADLNKIPTEDLGDVKPERYANWPSKEMYNTIEQEWLMESGSTSKEIESCLRGLIPDIVPYMNQAEINCLNSIFAIHIEEETVHEDIFKNSLETEARDQLVLRKFVSLPEIVATLYQGRTPDALDDNERNTYEHAESYLATEQDRIEPTWVIQQDCEWKNAIALRKASNGEARLNEFARQVRDAVTHLLANRVVHTWDLNATLPRDKYLAWLQIRDNMTLKINEEVESLRNRKKDAQWLCERATKFAYELFKDEASLFRKDNSPIHLESGEVAEKARGIEKAMTMRKDFRQPVLKTLAEKFEEGTKCLSAFVHLVQNHRRFDIALAFVDSEYNYPKIYCKREISDNRLVGILFCKCVGSFCVYHQLAYLYAEQYALVEGPDGIYRVVLSGLRRGDKLEADGTYRQFLRNLTTGEEVPGWNRSWSRSSSLRNE